ncbi:MAG: mechanosensitive ion channel family protein [Bryobacterales bacterium]|nr:mechanosensitive ion channel family protein [Bryobacterales bacterium]
MNFDLQKITDTVIATGTNVGLKVLGALILYMIGRWLISMVIRVISTAMERQKLEPTLLTYIASTVSVILNIALVVAILGYFGVETTSFAALLAAAGVAIGAAWAGLLANFAAGVFLIILHPFKKGDYITAGGQTGTVKEIGLFATTLLTPDNVTTIIGNNKIFGDTIQNYSSTPYRRVDLLAQLNGSVDANAAIRLLKDRIAKIPNVAAQPGPDVEILTFNLVGPVLAVRPYTHTDNYWQVYFDTNKVIREAFGEAGYPAPEPSYTVRTMGAAAGIGAVAGN